MIVAELLHFTPPLDGARADTEEGRDFLVGTLHSAELFELDQVDFRLRPRHVSSLPFEQAQFRAPVRQP
jgi:hypothetical protein